MNKKAMGLRPAIMGFGLIILFAFCMFGFAGNFLLETNPTSELLGSDYGLNNTINGFNESLSEFDSLQEKVKKNMENSDPSAVDFIFLIFLGAFTIPKAIFTSFVTGVNSLSTSIYLMLGGFGSVGAISVALGLLFAGLVITIVLLTVKAIRTGETEI